MRAIIKNLLQENREQYEQDQQKIAALKDMFEGKTITVSRDIHMNGKQGVSYVLSDFTFRVNNVEGSNGARYHSDNIRIVNSNDLFKNRYGWLLIKWLFSDVEILDGEIRRIDKGSPKKLNSINSDTKVQFNFIPVLHNVLLEVISGMISKEFEIPKDDITLRLDKVHISPEFLKKNNSIQPKTASFLRRFFVGKCFNFTYESYSFNQKGTHYYKIVDVKPVHGESYIFQCVVSETPFEGEVLFSGKNSVERELSMMCNDYFGVSKIKVQIVKQK